MFSGKPPVKLPSNPIFRQLLPIALCKCRERVEGSIISEGHTWDVHFLEIKEYMSAPSYMPLAPQAEALVFIRGESATRMSDALDSMMNILDAFPYNMKYNPRTEKLPNMAEDLMLPYSPWYQCHHDFKPSIPPLSLLLHGT